MLVTLSACLLGFANGLRHALEPDHLAAVSTLVAGERSSKASVRYAAAWGAGHAAMLLVAPGGPGENAVMFLATPSASCFTAKGSLGIATVAL